MAKEARVALYILAPKKTLPFPGIQGKKDRFALFSENGLETKGGKKVTQKYTT